MTLNGCAITGDGEKCSLDCAQEAGQALPSRPERARANDAKAWSQAAVVAPNSDQAPTNPVGSAPRGPIQRDYMD
jgi:hypothetical protein